MLDKMRVDGSSVLPNRFQLLYDLLCMMLNDVENTDGLHKEYWMGWFNQSIYGLYSHESVAMGDS